MREAASFSSLWCQSIRYVGIIFLATAGYNVCVISLTTTPEVTLGLHIPLVTVYRGIFWVIIRCCVMSVASHWHPSVLVHYAYTVSWMIIYDSKQQVIFTGTSYSWQVCKVLCNFCIVCWPPCHYVIMSHPWQPHVILCLLYLPISLARTATVYDAVLSLMAEYDAACPLPEGCPVSSTWWSRTELRWVCVIPLMPMYDAVLCLCHRPDCCVLIYSPRHSPWNHGRCYTVPSSNPL